MKKRIFDAFENKIYEERWIDEDSKKPYKTIYRYDDRNNLIYQGNIKDSITSYSKFKYNYFFGTGTNGFIDACNQYNKNQIKIHCENHSHNTYLTILSEQGIFIFIIFLIIIFKDIFLSLKINTNIDIHLIPFLILLTLINPISVSGDFFSTWTATFFWFIFAIYSGLIQLTKKKLNEKK